MTLRWCLPLVAAALGAGCAHQLDAAAESQKLLARDAEWADAASAGKDIDKIVSYWSDDALVVPPGQPVVDGKAAIRAFVAASLQIPGFKIHWRSEKVAFSPDGKLAYMRGASETTVPAGPNGALVTLHGRAVTVWRLERDGQWRCVADIWNEPPSAPPAQ
jgi:ketosteroid isomerase-like protein